MQPIQSQASSIDTWSLVRDLFSREHYHLHQIARLEKALSSAQTENHKELAAYNSLREQYGKLYESYTLLYAENERLRGEWRVCCCRMAGRLDDRRVEEVD
ncbi:hypothetical protein BDW75DRAFT_234159 [Aspergillus navahoensis]